MACHIYLLLTETNSQTGVGIRYTLHNGLRAIIPTAIPTDDLITMAELRSTQLSDVEQLGELLDHVFRRSKGITDQSQLTDFPLVLCADNFSNSRVIIEDGRVVSHAALWPRQWMVNGQKLKAAIIASVATYEEYRRRGFAAALVQSLHDTLRNEAYDVAVLWTSVPEFYAQLGWETVVPRGVLAKISFKDIHRLALVADLEIERFDVSRDLGAVRDIHDAEPVRMIRSSEEAHGLWCLPKLTTWVARKNGEIVAYAVNGQACNKQGLIEYGGEASDVVAIARHIAERLEPDDVIAWPVYGVRGNLKEWVMTSGLVVEPLPASKGANTEMLLPLNPDRLSTSVRESLFVWGLEWA